jgi:hypothetical protein
MDPTQRFADGDAAESPWYYDVPTVWDLGATTHPDVGAHNPPAEDAGHAHHPTPAEDAGHAHDPAPAEDAGHAHHPASLTPPDA